MEMTFTLLVRQAQQGDCLAERHLYQAAYDRLRTIARGLLRHERDGHTLQATALVAEAFVQKLRRMQLTVKDREHFYSLVAMAMKQVLVDHARRKKSRKRVAPADLALILGHPDWRPELQFALKQSMDRLESLDPKAHSVLVLRFVDGVSVTEIARAQGRPEWRVKADCQFGLSWLTAQLASAR